MDILGCCALVLNVLATTKYLIVLFCYNYIGIGFSPCIRGKAGSEGAVSINYTVPSNQTSCPRDNNFQEPSACEISTTRRSPTSASALFLIVLRI